MVLMKALEALLKSKALIFCLLCIPFVLLIIRGMQGGFLANPVEFIQLQSGEATLHILLVVLWMSPLKVLFPQAKPLKLLLRHRRMIGVGCFVYAMLHLVIHLLDARTVAELLETFTRPFILSGAVAFLILFAMALTSTNWAIKKMGGKQWKNLHRLVYLAAFLAFLHMILKEKSNVLVTLAYFVPLALAESYRLYLAWRERLQKLSAP